jgi:uracil-DNA glycosylase
MTLNLLSEPVARRSVPRSTGCSPAAGERLEADVVDCRACPRLVEWREQVAVEKRAAYRDEEYWGRRSPGSATPPPASWCSGLAPAAHGANRTGRVFTGDRSGDWLFRAMHRAGLANQPTSVAADDGLALDGAWVTAAVKCAPPGNQPLPAERDACAPFLARELAALADVRVIVCLGQFGYDAACRHLGVSPRPRFGHGVEVPLDATGPVLLCSFHPSQQNTFTGRLTEPMLDAVFARAVAVRRSPNSTGSRRISSTAIPTASPAPERPDPAQSGFGAAAFFFGGGTPIAGRRVGVLRPAATADDRQHASAGFIAVSSVLGRAWR